MAPDRRLRGAAVLVAGLVLVAGCGAAPGTEAESRYRVSVQEFTDTTVRNVSFTGVESVPGPVGAAIAGTENSTELRGESSVAVSRETFREALGAYHEGPVPGTLASEYEYYIRYDGRRYLVEFRVLKE